MAGNIIYPSGGMTLDVSEVTANSATVRTGYRGISNNGVYFNGSIPNKSGENVTPGTNAKTVNTSGYYMLGNIVVAGDADLTAANIKKGVNVFGVTGAFTSDATAAANQILSGKTAYVNGAKVTGNMAVQSVLNFSASALSYNSVRVSWTNPSKGPYLSIRILGKTGGNPSESSYTLSAEGTGTSAVAGQTSSHTFYNLVSSTRYYFSIRTYCIINGSRVYHPTTLTANVATPAIPCSCNGDCSCDYECSCDYDCCVGNCGCDGQCTCDQYGCDCNGDCSCHGPGNL